MKTSPDPNVPLLIFFTLIHYGIVIYVLIVHVKTRNKLRRKYNINPNDGCIVDCCAVYWCACCSICQMARHTADYKKQHAQLCSETGLDDYYNDDDTAPLPPHLTTQIV